MNIKRTALLLMDMQNDFLHADGAFGRVDQRIDNKRTVIEQLLKVVDAIKAKGGFIISTNFTLISDKDSIPIISEKIKAESPFLTRGDFQQGRWGHQLIDEFSPADYVVNKIADSAFYMTHLEWLLGKLNIENLIFAGLWSNPNLNPTIRDAQHRGFNIISLQDGSTSFSKGELNMDGIETEICANFANYINSL